MSRSVDRSGSSDPAGCDFTDWGSLFAFGRSCGGFWCSSFRLRRSNNLRWWNWSRGRPFARVPDLLSDGFIANATWEPGSNFSLNADNGEGHVFFFYFVLVKVMAKNV